MKKHALIIAILASSSAFACPTPPSNAYDADNGQEAGSTISAKLTAFATSAANLFRITPADTSAPAKQDQAQPAPGQAAAPAADPAPAASSKETVELAPNGQFLAAPITESAVQPETAAASTQPVATIVVTAPSATAPLAAAQPETTGYDTDMPVTEQPVAAYMLLKPVEIIDRNVH